jgi:hypothetical protein
LTAIEGMPIEGEGMPIEETAIEVEGMLKVEGMPIEVEGKEMEEVTATLETGTAMVNLAEEEGTAMEEGNLGAVGARPLNRKAPMVYTYHRDG